MTPIVYLAGPYSHPDPAVRVDRFNALTAAAADLVRAGRVVYSPITSSHPIDLVLNGPDQPGSSDFWVDFDEAFMAVCAEIHVLMIAGWDCSSGVAREIAYFEAAGKPIKFVGVERIVSAAVRSGGLILSMPPPARHAHLLHAMHDQGLADKARMADQAFLTSTGRFVDREEAFRIAKTAGQKITRQPDGYNGDDLYTEDLW